MSKILLIDDDAGIRETIGHSLEMAGYDVAVAEHGKEGLKLLETTDPDLILCDILMPEKEGIETIMEIRDTGSDVAIIAMSGGGQYVNDKHGFLDVVFESAQLFGANYSLRKPFRPKELLELVEKALTENKGAE